MQKISLEISNKVVKNMPQVGNSHCFLYNNQQRVHTKSAKQITMTAYMKPCWANCCCRCYAESTSIDVFVFEWNLINVFLQVNHSISTGVVKSQLNIYVYGQIRRICGHAEE